MRYRHTQIGYAVIIIVVAVGLFSLTVAMNEQLRSGLLLSESILVVVLLLFPTLTVSVDTSHVVCFFGVGLIRRRIELARIARVSVVKNHWLTGFGIRLTPRGWLWNVSGRSAVELELRDGSHFRIGSDEPERLCAVVSEQLAHR